ncbi:hypothetical protein J1N35_028918, partial [Gossypium stocksii]
KILFLNKIQFLLYACYNLLKKHHMIGIFHLLMNTQKNFTHAPKIPSKIEIDFSGAPKNKYYRSHSPLAD